MSPQAYQFNQVKVTPGFINSLASITEVLGDEINVGDSLVVITKTPRAQRMIDALVDMTGIQPDNKNDASGRG